MIYIGIDPGVNTGLALWDSIKKELSNVITCNFIKAFYFIQELDCVHNTIKKTIILEDARFVKYKTDPVKAQGAGSVKRDCSIWEEFFIEENIPYRLVRPNKRTTKWNRDQFKKYTGYEGRTSQHARDAAMLVYQLK